MGLDVAVLHHLNFHTRYIEIIQLITSAFSLLILNGGYFILK